jgi:hypothetical protein
VVSGVNDTVDHWWAVSMRPLTKIDIADQGTLKFKLLKGIPIEKFYKGKWYYAISTTFTQKYGGKLRITFVASGDVYEGSL